MKDNYFKRDNYRCRQIEKDGTCKREVICAGREDEYQKKNEFRKERTVMPDKRLAGQTIMVRV